MCDPDERCSGVVGEGCPANVVANPSTVCRTGSGDSCDPDETCTAIPGAACPSDVVATAGTRMPCRERYLRRRRGVQRHRRAACPADALAAAETPCDADNDPCTVDECDGGGMCVQLSPTTCGDRRD